MIMTLPSDDEQYRAPYRTRQSHHPLPSTARGRPLPRYECLTNDNSKKRSARWIGWRAGWLAGWLAGWRAG
jgi:hypothetical protein